MAKIDKVSTWAKLASPPTEDPPQARKDSGWNGGEQPEAEYWNFLEEEDRDKLNEMVDEVNPNTEYRPDLNSSLFDPSSTDFVKGLRPNNAGGQLYAQKNQINFVTVELVDIAYAVIGGVKKILVLDRLLAKIYIVDVDSHVIESNSGTNIAAGLPSGGTEDWIVTSFCTDGTYVYVLAYDADLSPNETHRIQSYQISDWSVNSAWPSTGTLLTGTGASTFLTTNGYEVERVRFISSTKLGISQSWNTITANTSPGIAIIDSANGAKLTEGAAGLPDSPSTAAVATGGLVGVGSNVYFSVVSTAGNSRVYVSAALISDATTLPAATSWPDDMTSDHICVSMIYDGFHVSAVDQHLTAPDTGSSMTRHWGKDGTRYQTIYGPDTAISDKQDSTGLLYMLYDGVNTWFNETLYYSVSTQNQYLQRTELTNFIDDSARNKNWYQLNTKLFWTGLSITNVNTPGPMVFDGRDIWLIPQIKGDRIQRMRHSMIR